MGTTTTITEPSAPTKGTALNPFGIFYEQQQWFRPLFDKLEQREIPFARIDARRHHFDPAALNGDTHYSLIFNRMSPSAYHRGNANGIFYTHAYLENLERQGKRVINGSKAFR